MSSVLAAMWRDQHFGGGARESLREVVMFGDPEALVAQFLGVLGALDGVLEGFGRAPALGDRREVDDGEVHVGLTVSKRKYRPPQAGWPPHAAPLSRRLRPR